MPTNIGSYTPITSPHTRQTTCPIGIGKGWPARPFNESVKRRTLATDSPSAARTGSSRSTSVMHPGADALGAALEREPAREVLASLCVSYQRAIPTTAHRVDGVHVTVRGHGQALAQLIGLTFGQQQ